MPRKNTATKVAETSDAVCREVRYQMVAYGGIADNQKLFSLLEKWMKSSKRKSRFIRP
jgi:hypothetical protein